jgi:N-acetylglucosaminyl-diphospho-decaprenol L-rhamnosyltransferase
MESRGTQERNSRPPDLSIVIVTYRSRDVILPCLSSLEVDRPSPSMECIVVDNHSADGTSKAVTAHFPAVQVIANTTNRGYPAAANQAASQAHGRYLLFLNPDTVVDVESLIKMVAWMDAHPEVGACGPEIRFPSGRVQPSVLPLPNMGNTLAGYLGLKLLHRANTQKPTVLKEGMYLLGACLMIRRATWEHTGPLDEQLFWIEDADWALRAQQQGWQLAYLPQGSVVHVGEASAHRDVYVKVTRQHLNRLDFFEKHGERTQQIAVRLALLSIVSAKFVLRTLQHTYCGSSEIAERLRAYRYVMAVALGLAGGDSK